MAERFNAPVLKTGVRKDTWVRIPLPPLSVSDWREGDSNGVEPEAVAPLAYARPINQVPVKVGNAQVVIRGTPDFLTAREGDRETGIPGNQRTATVPNLYCTFQRSIRTVDLPHIDTVPTHLS